MPDQHTTRSLIAGGAGFIGSHLTRELPRRPGHEVVVLDNFCSGDAAHLDGLLDEPRLRVIEADIKQLGVYGDRGTQEALRDSIDANIEEAVREGTHTGPGAGGARAYAATRQRPRAA
jgi:nucleoside-diphosphate-sugar epimerase